MMTKKIITGYIADLQLITNKNEHDPKLRRTREMAGELYVINSMNLKAS
jgi:hypothetical protein